MFIKNLTLNGFKAFGEKTTIEFQDGIGALVGPNGSGKSNIIDAIKWVIGESKVSEIRGEKLEDLIYHGSVESQQQNMAEVEMVMDNTQNILPISFKEVSIMRRLYRSGATEFFINRKGCRLKDIQELFMNTGLGRGNYSVIPQGKIDQILHNKSGDRRKLLEESSSLSLYQEKKKEYEGQIQKTEENLKHLDTILKSEERKKEQLSEQSQKSEQFFNYEKLKKELQVNLLLHELHSLKQQERNSTVKKKELSIKIEQVGKDIEKAKKEIEENEKKIGTQHEGLADLEKIRIKKEEQLGGLKKEKNSLLEQVSESERYVVNMEHNLNHHDGETKDLKEKIKTSTNQLKTGESELAKIEKSIERKKAKLKEIKKKIEAINLDAKNIREKIANAKKDLKQNSHEVREIVNHLIGDIDQLKKKLDQEKIVDNRQELVKQSQAIEKALREVSKKKSSPLETLLPQINSFFSTFEKYFSIEDPFYRFFFSAEGTYSKKENLEKKIVELEQAITDHEKKIEELNVEHSQLSTELQGLQIEFNKMQGSISSLKHSIERHQKEIQQFEGQLTRSHNIFEKTKGDIKITKDKIKNLKQNQTENEKVLRQFEKEIATLTQNIDNFSSHQKSFEDKLNQSKGKHRALEDRFKNLQAQDQQLEIGKAGNESDVKNLYERALEQFSIDLHQHESVAIADPRKVKEDIRSFEEKIKNLGPTNHLAKVEYDQCVAKLIEMYDQKKDIVEAMEDLQNLSAEMLEKSQAQFLETFKVVKKHFSTIIKKLFINGEGELTLTDENDPLNSDIEIWVKPHGKKIQKMNLFSGGEKTLIAVAFMFSFFMTKPSPLCLLDEVDAALDSANIQRFVDLLKSIKDATQLIFITHNQKTMQVFDYVYGISIRDGKTKVLSLKL